MDFVHWRLALNGDKSKRPKQVPKRVPESAWEVAAQVDRIANLMGPQEAFLDWAEWRRFGAKRSERPRSAPERIPKSWFEALVRLEQIFKGVKSPQKPTPETQAETEAGRRHRDDAERAARSGPRTAEDARAVHALAPARQLQRRRRPRDPADVRGDLQAGRPRPAPRRQPDGARDGQPDVLLVAAAAPQPGRDRRHRGAAAPASPSRTGTRRRARTSDGCSPTRSRRTTAPRRSGS